MLTTNSVSLLYLVFARDFRYDDMFPEVDESLTYDFNSMMHYGLKAGCIDCSKPTIILKQPWKDRCAKDPKCFVGQRHGLSEQDAFQVNKLFNCKGKTTVQKGCQVYDPEDFAKDSWPGPGHESCPI